MERPTHMEPSITFPEEELLHWHRFATLGEICSNLSHDINNPLAIALGNVRILKRVLAQLEVTDAKVTEVLAGIEKSAERISTLTKALRGVSHHAIRPRLFDLKVCLEDCFALIGHNFRRRNIDLQLDFRGDSWAIYGHESVCGLLILRCASIVISNYTLLPESQQALDEKWSYAIIAELTANGKVRMIFQTNIPCPKGCDAELRKDLDESRYAVGVTFLQRLVKNSFLEIEKIAANENGLQIAIFCQTGAENPLTESEPSPAQLQPHFPANEAQHSAPNCVPRGLILEPDVPTQQILKKTLQAKGHELVIANTLFEASEALSGDPFDYLIVNFSFRTLILSLTRELAWAENIPVIGLASETLAKGLVHDKKFSYLLTKPLVLQKIEDVFAKVFASPHPQNCQPSHEPT